MAKHAIKLGQGLKKNYGGYKILAVDDNHVIDKERLIKIDFDGGLTFFFTEQDALEVSFLFFDIVEARKKARGET